MIMLVGTKGVLSSAIQEVFNGESIHIVDQAAAYSWASPTTGNRIAEYVSTLRDKPKLILNASGIVDPTASPEVLINVNYNLPKNLAEFANQNGTKLVTFGTIMENFEDLAVSNPYLSSKKKYYDYFVRSSQQHASVLHLQAHTWYGGNKLKSHMFLGQIFSAIQKRTIFKMSMGKQLREYHHLFDDLCALKHLLNSGAYGVFQLNHGEALSLQEVASHVFSEFNLSELLRIGVLPMSSHENLDATFLPDRLLSEVAFRGTLRGITDYMRFLLNGEK